MLAIPQKRQQRSWNYLPTSEIEQENIPGCVWSSPGWDVSVCRKTAQGSALQNTRSNIRACFVHAWPYLVFLVIPRLYSKFQLWMSRRFVQGAELTLPGPFVRWVWKCSCSLIHTGGHRGQSRVPVFKIFNLRVLLSTLSFCWWRGVRVFILNPTIQKYIKNQ